MSILKGIGIAVVIVAAVFVGLVLVGTWHSYQSPTKENIEVINSPGAVNLTEIEGNVTSVKKLDNGTYQITVSSSKEHKYKDNVIAAIKKEAGQFANVCSVQITTKDDNESRVVYEKPNSVACKFVEPRTETPPPIINETKPPVVVPPVINETKPPVVVPPVVTPPAPEPKTIKVILTGDITSGTAGTSVFNQIKKQNPDNVIVLGDLGYGSNLAWFKSTYGTLGNKLNCLIGNHDAANEDGTAAIEKEAKAYCTDNYYFKKNNVLFMAFNTNGDLVRQATEAGKLLQNKDFMTGIKSVHVMGHKGCAVPPNAHHPLEIKTFCDAVRSKLPAGVQYYNDAAHNHVLAQTSDKHYTISGSGGKSHYTCGVNQVWTFCDNIHYGFLVYTITQDGTTTSQFVDNNGVVVK